MLPKFTMLLNNIGRLLSQQNYIHIFNGYTVHASLLTEWNDWAKD